MYLNRKRRVYLGLMMFVLFFLELMVSCKLNKTTFKGSKQTIRKVPSSMPNEDDATVNTDSMDVPDSAVSKGSFTVWTEPEDPAPMQYYYVIVQVKLDKGISSYSKNDLTGTLVGTDGYDQQIGRYGDLDTLKHYPSKGYARLKTFVPGSYDNVRDDIKIHSDLLNETQNISIVF